VALRLIYLVFSKLLSWMILAAQSQQAKEIEILVQRHQLAILQRRIPRPRMNWADRALAAALARLLPTAPTPRVTRHARHHPALAPATRRPRLDHRTHAARAATTPLRPLCPCRAPGQGELHVGLRQAAPLRPLPDHARTGINNVCRRDRLGGLLHEYEQVA